jgi:transposase
MIQQEIATRTDSPESVEELTSLVLSQQEQLESFKREEKGLKVENQILRERIKKLTRQLYGRKSEKYVLEDSSDQMCLFEDEDNDVESSQDTDCSKVLGDGSQETIIVAEHKRKKGGRKPLPVELPRVEVVHDLCAEEKQCSCGSEMSRIGSVSSEKLEMLPAQMWVLREVRYKYACKECEGVESPEGTGAVKIAASSAQIVPKSIATPSWLAHVFVSKFADSLPFYRQEKQFLRYGIELSRSRMCHWAFHVSDQLERLLDMLWIELRSGAYMSLDETTVQVLNEPDRPASSKSYMWVIRGSPGGKDKGIVIFHYSPSRSGEVARQLIGNHQGYVQTDGFSGYDFLDSRVDIVHVGCWAHARRKFVEVASLYNKSKKKRGGIGKAGHALQTIGKLYQIEKKARQNDLSAQELYQLRQDEAKPILEEFKEWLQDNVVNIPPKSSLGAAFIYTLNQWPRLINYLQSGILPIDNNLTENAIRPFVVGRKNWLFSDQPRGAQASALFYTLIETAKENGLEPYAYFLYLFDRLPHAITEDDWKQLLPIYITPERLTEFKKEYWMKYDGKSDALKK